MTRQKAHQKIDYIFKTLLPAHGMPERAEQIRLSHTMLDAMLDSRIALCDAGTGIGKTYAYLVAGIVFHEYRAASGLPVQPLIISTSSIALQNAVQGEYLPLLSRILIEDAKLSEPLYAVIRKGKSHYVCDQRLQKRLKHANLDRKNECVATALQMLQTILDLDMAPHLSGYDREQVCVPPSCDCARQSCRYLRFLDICNAERYIFQICNHNLLLADAIHRSHDRRPILPDSCCLILDEAHKLPETARQMFGVTLSTEDFRDLICGLRAERYVLAAERLEETAKPLLCELAAPSAEEPDFPQLAELMTEPDALLHVIRRQLGRLLTPATRRQLGRLLTPATRRQLEAVASAVTMFGTDDPATVCYAVQDASGGTTLCTAVSDLTAQLRSTLWALPRPVILTSATMAVHEDFRRFKQECGLLRDPRVTQTVAASPFDYEHNCLLYLPQFPPNRQDEQYYDELSDEIIRLLRASHGHALVLFTSYAAMSAVKERLRGAGLPYPLFTMGRNAGHTLERFKAHPGSILLATGAAWEGFDFPGDCVSMLIIPRLPFAYPDARKEQERAQYASLQAFIRAVVVPEMQIKLKQGFGRAIRTETDTCVVAILDERAARGRRYFRAVRDALPKMHTTSSLRSVERFLREVKPERYFQEGLQDGCES